MYRKILVATDGSESAEKAVRVAVEEAKIHNASLHALYVVNPGISQTVLFSPTTDVLDRSPEIINDLLVKEAEDVLNSVRNIAGEKGMEVNTHIEWGDAREEILSLADRLEVDLIVIGSTGKSNLSRLLLGSVSTSVVSHSNSATLVVRG